MKYVMMLLLVLMVASGCAPTVEYGDAQAVETVTTDFGSTDLQLIGERMAESLLASEAIAGERPVVYFAGVKNKTEEHLPMSGITDKIRTALLRTGRVRFSAAMEMGEELKRQLEYQTSAGMVRPDTAKQFGQQIGADYFLYGEIIDIRKEARGVTDVYFKFNLNLVDIENGLIVWADEKEIRKGSRKRLFGR